ncbi:inovirus-type Gp2 protein [Shewanella xiamenensis]|uniref:YagK/YfjJ domain-containing protein n=1 Tax=Shewanella xiamenensis TaxID=332186 RepID=UPI0035BB5EC3
MKYISYQEWIEHGGQVYRVQAKPSGIHTQPFKTFLDELNWMLNAHSKVFLFRFDLRFSDDNQGMNNSNLLRIFFRRLVRQLQGHYQTKDIAYSWSRELEKAKQQHYHCILMMDGNRILRPHFLCIKIREIWLQISGGSPYWSRWYHFHRSDLRTQSKAIYHSSYLFKVRGKGYKPQYAKDYGHSNLREKVK